MEKEGKEEIPPGNGFFSLSLSLSPRPPPPLSREEQRRDSRLKWMYRAVGRG
jgi:hypothetical protein